MKISITEGQRSFGFSIPNALAMNRLTAWIACSTAQKHTAKDADALSADALARIFAEMNRIRKQYGSWVLVEVEKADGGSVTISI